MSKFIDRTGQKFGRLTLIERVENNKFNQVQWLCKCDCGNTKIAKAQSFNIRIKYNECEYTLSELSRIYNIKRATLYDRIKRGWTIDEALNKKVAKGIE